MTQWRFDQGRLDYFRIDEIRNIAVALASVDGMEKPTAYEGDILRGALAHHSALPFPPHQKDYPVWRNFGRVFQCMMLATDIGGRIVATDLCKIIATDPGGVDPDDYLAHFARRFYYPAPFFEHYDPAARQVFPVAAILKLLISESLTRGKRHISIDDIADLLIANDVTGVEDLNFYSGLAKRALPPTFQARQLRELVRVISQFSFLKWINPHLHLEAVDNTGLLAIAQAVQPSPKRRHADPDAEILALGDGFSANALGPAGAYGMEGYEDAFTEGKKVRRTHLTVERSSKLREMYFNAVPSANLCNMCSMDTVRRYPWTNRLIELHHLLPLSSPIRVETAKTSLRDMVGLCPSCHRATHRFYSFWLKKTGLTDFRSHSEARGVYFEAKEKIVLTV